MQQHSYDVVIVGAGGAGMRAALESSSRVRTAVLTKTGQLIVLVQRYPPLVDGAFIIIAWVGVKLCLEDLHEAGFIALDIPRWLSLEEPDATLCRPSRALRRLS